jgi:hypothetical protein
MPFQLFGLSPEASMYLLFGFCGVVFLGGLIAAIAAACCCCREDDSDPDALLLRTAPSAVTIDDLIPPIYYTADMKDPLFQADLKDTSISSALN